MGVGTPGAIIGSGYHDMAWMRLFETHDDAREPEDQRDEQDGPAPWLRLVQDEVALRLRIDPGPFGRHDFPDRPETLIEPEAEAWWRTAPAPF